jgi:sugar lactone lactonase YvrE
VAFSPDGVTLASAGGNGLRLWNPATGEQLRTRIGGNSWAASVAFSPDGATLASASDAGVRLWNPATGEELRTLRQTSAVRSVAFSRDGLFLASAGYDGTVRLWDPASGEELRTLTGHTRFVQSVAFSADGAFLASTDEAAVRLWDPATGEELRTLAGHTGTVQSVAFSPDGTLLASTGDDGTIRTWNPRNGQQQAGTGFGTAVRALRPLPGLHSDNSSVEDLLGNATDVEMLAMLAAAHDTRPPLAIAVLGQWGAGKSSFMDQMRRQVTQLADLSANNPGRSAFASVVRQIRFNAWHYSDDHLWTGLVEHLFQSLAATPGQEAVVADQDGVRGERERLATWLASLEEDQRLLQKELDQAKASRPGGFVAWVGSPVETLRLPFLAGWMVLRDAWRARWAILGMVIAVSAFYAGRQWIGAWAAALIGAVGLLTPVLLPVWAVVRRWHRQGQTITGRFRAALEGRQKTLNDEVSAAQSRLAEVDAAVRLSAFLTERSAPNAYQAYRGLLGQVHRDLVQLDQQLRQVRAQWELTRPATPPPLERIVLYIDDLDRCPPARVVEVLAAVHLMLALPLFVVVVAVDARWLLNSLQHHYRELFAAEAAAGGSVEPEGSATPLDYLDKIFQVPFAVPPASPETTGRYLRALLATPAPASGPATAGTASPSATVPGAPGRSRPAAESDRAAVTDPGPLQRATLGEPDPFRDFERLGHIAAGVRRVVPDLQPEQLTLQAIEVDFMERLGGLTPTPRAAKKLVNLYRLVRISIDRHDLAAFVGTPQTAGSHQIVQLLLAVLVGSPRHSNAIFEAILNADPASDITEVLRTAPLANTSAPALADLIDKLSTTGRVITATARFQPWCARLARFSFHTRSLAEQHQHLSTTARPQQDRS